MVTLATIGLTVLGPERRFTRSAVTRTLSAAQDKCAMSTTASSAIDTRTNLVTFPPWARALNRAGSARRADSVADYMQPHSSVFASDLDHSGGFGTVWSARAGAYRPGGSDPKPARTLAWLA